MIYFSFFGVTITNKRRIETHTNKYHSLTIRLESWSEDEFYMRNLYKIWVTATPASNGNEF